MKESSYAKEPMDTSVVPLPVLWPAGTFSFWYNSELGQVVSVWWQGKQVSDILGTIDSNPGVNFYDFVL